jgi:hypothetical protein
MRSGVLKKPKLFGAVMRGSNVYDPHILQAIRRIRGMFPHSYPISTKPSFIAAGRHKIIALTNNFAKIDVPLSERAFLGWVQGATPEHLTNLFDDFCDSSTLGMR